MVTLVNSVGERIFSILQGMYDTRPEARVLLRKLVAHGLTHAEVSLVYALQRTQQPQEPAAVPQQKIQAI